MLDLIVSFIIPTDFRRDFIPVGEMEYQRVTGPSSSPQQPSQSTQQASPATTPAKHIFPNYTTTPIQFRTRYGVLRRAQGQDPHAHAKKKPRNYKIIYF